MNRFVEHEGIQRAFKYFSSQRPFMMDKKTVPIATKVRPKPFVIPNNNPSTWYVDNLRIIITEYVYKYKK